MNFIFNDEPVITPLSNNSNSNFTTKFKGRGELYIDNELVGESILESKWMSTIMILLGFLSSMITTIMYIRDLSIIKKSELKFVEKSTTNDIKI